MGCRNSSGGGESVSGDQRFARIVEFFLTLKRDAAVAHSNAEKSRWLVLMTGVRDKTLRETTSGNYREADGEFGMTSAERLRHRLYFDD